MAELEDVIDLEAVLGTADVIYLTRAHSERMTMAQRFEPAPRARILTPAVIERGSSATRWALIGVQLRSDNLAI